MERKLGIVKMEGRWGGEWPSVRGMSEAWVGGGVSLWVCACESRFFEMCVLLLLPECPSCQASVPVQTPLCKGSGGLVQVYS